MVEEVFRCFSFKYDDKKILYYKLKYHYSVLCVSKVKGLIIRRDQFHLADYTFVLLIT